MPSREIAGPPGKTGVALVAPSLKTLGYGLLAALMLGAPIPASAQPVPIDARTDWTLALPAVGSTTPAPPTGAEPPIRQLRDAAAARARARVLIASEDWAGASTALYEAVSNGNYCAPNVVFDLALAHERAGHAPRAGLWFAVYLALSPDAPNAPAVRANVTRIADQLEAHSGTVFGEAERLALLLSADSASGARSLRQRALEDIANMASFGGLEDHSARALALARSVPNALPHEPSSLESHGLWVTIYTGDDATANAIARRWRRDIPEATRVGMLAQLYAMRGDFSEAGRVLDGIRTSDLAEAYSISGTLEDLSRNGAHAEAIRTIRRRLTAGMREPFNGNLYSLSVRIAENAFFGGRPDLALPLAQLLHAYFEEQRPRADLYYWYAIDVVVLAMLGDAAAIERIYGVGLYMQLSGFNDSANRVAAAAAASMTSDRAVSLYATMRDRLMTEVGRSIEADEQLRIFFTNAFFAKRAMEGRARDALEQMDFGEDEARLAVWERALLYAVTANQSDAAWSVAELMHGGDSALVGRAMQRLANRGHNASDQARLDTMFAHACQGWRPSSMAQARLVRWRISQAASMSDDATGNGELPETLEATLREAPERAAGQVAQAGVMFHLYAQVLRASGAPAGRTD